MIKMLKEEVIIYVEGISDKRCIGIIKKSLEKIDGVISVDVNLHCKKVTIEYDQVKTKVVYLKEAITGAGYVIVY